MKRNVGFGIIVSFIILMTGVCGCMMNNSDLPGNAESEAFLNQRQKDILAEQGLPTEYQELSVSQQRAIVEFGDYLAEHQLYGMAQIILLKDGKIAYLTKYNFTDYLSEEYYTVRETLYVNK